MEGRKKIKKILLAIVLIPIGIIAVNWIMTFRLEDTLRRRLRSEVIKATDGFYDCHFDKLKVDFFTGELMLAGLTFFPDSSSLATKRNDSQLPPIFFDIQIDTIDFKGINLTWKFSYSKLFFKEFLVKKPSIKIYSPGKEFRAPIDSLHQTKSFYESVSSLFDVIQARFISLKQAQVLYQVEDLETVSYTLKDFDFTAYNFQLDEHSQDRGLLMFSDDFVFKASTPQPIFESEKYRFDIGGIELSTIDSIIHVTETHFRSKEKYWENRRSWLGSHSNIEVGDFKLQGIHLDRKGPYNFLDSRKLYVNSPMIEHFVVRDENKSSSQSDEQQQEDDVKADSWSLYAVTRPIFEKIGIDEIDIEEAHFKYVITENEESDQYLLNRLDFRALGFIVDSLHQDYNVINYVEDFDIEASQVEGHLPSKNTLASVDSFKLSSIEKLFKLSKIQLSPISLIPNKEHLYGEIEEFEVRNIRYEEGIDADLIYIESPKVEYVSSATAEKKTKPQKVKENDIAGTIHRFVHYLSVKDVIISNGNASFTDRKSDNKYTFQNLDFSVKNFFVDGNVKFFKDYIFHWDEYKIKFKDFDNLTPDKQYRVKISEGNFNSVAGNILVKNLEITPRDTVQNSFIKISAPFANLTEIDQGKIKDKQIRFKIFNLEQPIIEYVKKTEENPEDYKRLKTPLWWELVQFDTLNISSPVISYQDRAKELSAEFRASQLVIDSFDWSVNKHLKVSTIDLLSPDVSVVEGKAESKFDGGKAQSTFPTSLGEISVDEVKMEKAKLHLKRMTSELTTSVDHYLQKGFYWGTTKDSLLQIAEIDIANPTVKWDKQLVQADEKNKDDLELPKDIAQVKLGKLNLSNLNLEQHRISAGNSLLKNKLNNTTFLLENFHADLINKKYTTEELAFNTKNFSYPTSEYYTFHFNEIDFSKKRGVFELDKIKLIPSYPKFEFAYKHPRGADWFEAEIDNIRFSGLDFSSYETDSIILVKNLDVDYILLQNLKNQKIEIEHNLMPLFYEQFQRFPIKYHIDDVSFKDFTIIYEELPRKGSFPLRIPFASMNFTTKNFTNLQSGKGDFYTFNVDGMAMGVAPFTGKWTMPVDTINDKFFFSADIRDLDLKVLNQIIYPGSPIYVKKGYANRLYLNTEATSKEAIVDLIFEYDDMDVVILKQLGDSVENKMMTGIINRWIIEEKNKGKHMRVIHDTIVRDPYHSNFNYFWQMLKPTIVEAVGVTEEKQNVLHNLGVIIKRMKSLFKREKKDKK